MRTGPDGRSGRAGPGRGGRSRRALSQRQRPARPPRHPDTVPIEPFDPSDPGLHIDPDDGGPLMRPPGAPCTPAWPRSNTTPTPPHRPAGTGAWTRLRRYRRVDTQRGRVTSGPDPDLCPPHRPHPRHRHRCIARRRHRAAARRTVGGAYRPRPVHREAGHRPQRCRQRRRLRDPRPDPRTRQSHPPRRALPVRQPRSPSRHGSGPHPALRPRSAHRARPAPPTSRRWAASVTGSRPTPAAGTSGASTPRPWNGPHPTASPSASTPPEPTECMRRVRQLTQAEPNVRDR